MSKKILSVMLALVLVLSTFAVSAFAAVGVGHEEPNEDEVIENTQVWSLEAAEEADANGYYAVTVSLKTNYDAVSAISFVLNVEGATLADYVCNIDADADIVADDETGLVNIYPMPDTADDAAYDFTAGAAVATLYYELNGDSATITLNNDAKCYDNPDGKLFAVRSSDGKLAGSAIYGQRVVDAEGADIALDAEIASVTIGAAEPNTLVILNNEVKFSNAYCNTANNGILCGFSSFTNASTLTTNLSTTLGKEYLNVVVNSANKTSTGAIIQVLDADGVTVLETYVVVIFGDIDGNGRFQAADVKAGAGALTSINSNSQSPLKVAANCDGGTNMRVNAADMKALAAAVTTFGSKQVTLAEAIF